MMTTLFTLTLEQTITRKLQLVKDQEIPQPQNPHLGYLNAISPLHFGFHGPEIKYK